MSRPADITGQLILTRQLTTVGGQPFSVKAIKVDQTPENVARLTSVSEHWDEIAEGYRRQGIARKVPGHAQFAADTAWYGARCVIPASECDTLVLINTLGHNTQIEGIAVYTVEPPRGDIILFTVSPLHQPETPDHSHPKGLGSTLLDALKIDMQRRSVQTIELSPLDRYAEAWWRSKGFAPTDGVWRANISDIVSGDFPGEPYAAKKPVLLKIARPRDLGLYT